MKKKVQAIGCIVPRASMVGPVRTRAFGIRTTTLVLFATFLLVIGSHVAQADVIRAQLDEDNADKLIFVSKFCYSTTGTSLRWQPPRLLSPPLLLFHFSLSHSCYFILV
jgi:hypothetical protein